MPERLMGTDCKFDGDMSTLVQIQLGPKMYRFMSMIKFILQKQKCLICINKEKNQFFALSICFSFVLF
ncbi:hypothetical protein M6B38_100005 [Iris pallida]|uniref:Uncharacterized protein n=1 Tax=Iris pallida TaxID=29817 RepID=A0AAX6IM59_IRIPA|nr:hypothetical protein M6B38_100005 [Iris pallida]